MPLYEYVCRSCESRFEVLTSASSGGDRCPGCVGGDLERQLSVFSVGKGGARAGRPGWEAAPAPCGCCGDPRGPGACKLD